MLLRVSALATAVAGCGLVGLGAWGRREARRALAQEHIVSPADGSPVLNATGARGLAEFIRAETLAATEGRTYAETEDETPEHDLWIQSTTLQTALMQAYMAFRVSELTTVLGVSFVVVGLGLGWKPRN